MNNSSNISTIAQSFSQNGLSKDSLKGLLKDRVVSIVFNKKDGSVRRLRGTLKGEFIVPYEKTTERTKPDNPTVVSVWDLDNDGWRSVIISSITALEIIE
jgi:uncharacterized membrane-anchored protein